MSLLKVWPISPNFQANNYGSLQILCEYYHLRCPARGTKLHFHPLEHLHPLEYHRPDEMVLHTAGSTIELRSCSSSLEFVEVDVRPSFLFAYVWLFLFFLPRNCCIFHISRVGHFILLFLLRSGTHCTLGRGGSYCTINMDCCLLMWILAAWKCKFMSQFWIISYEYWSPLILGFHCIEFLLWLFMAVVYYNYQGKNV